MILASEPVASYRMDLVTPGPRTIRASIRDTSWGFIASQVVSSSRSDWFERAKQSRFSELQFPFQAIVKIFLQITPMSSPRRFLGLRLRLGSRPNKAEGTA